MFQIIFSMFLSFLDFKVIERQPSPWLFLGDNMKKVWLEILEGLNEEEQFCHFLFLFLSGFFFILTVWLVSIL